MNKLNFSVGLLCLIVFIGCGNSNSKQNATTKVSVDRESAKIVIFNEIDKTIARLTLNGIGELGNWQSDGMGEYMSITPYFQFGAGRPQNNISYYLTGKNNNYIQKLQLTLNVNNISEKKQALKKFSEITEKTFKSLDLEVPQGLLNAAKAGQSFNFENENHLVSIISDKDNIETFTLFVHSK